MSPLLTKEGDGGSCFACGILGTPPNPPLRTGRELAALVVRALRIRRKTVNMLDQLLGSLKIDPMILLINGILFLVLVQIMSRLFWKPMMAHLDRRKDDIAHAYKAVDETRRDMENLRGEYQARLAQIESEARVHIQETVRDAQKQREELMADARSQSEATIRAGAESIEQEKAQAVVSMRENLDEVAESALAKAVGAPPAANQKKLIDDYITKEVLKS